MKHRLQSLKKYPELGMKILMYNVYLLTELLILAAEEKVYVKKNAYLGNYPGHCRLGYPCDLVDATRPNDGLAGRIWWLDWWCHRGVNRRTHSRGDLDRDL